MASEWDRFAPVVKNEWDRFKPVGISASGANDIPRGVGDVAGPAAPVESPAKPSPFELPGLAGLGEAGMSIASAIPSLTYGMMVGAGDLYRSGKYGTPEGARLMENTATKSMGMNTYHPRTSEGRSTLRYVGDKLQQFLPVAGLGAELSAIARSVPAVSRAAGDITGSGIGKVGDALVRGKIDPQVAELARVATKYDIPLAPHMLGVDNKFSRMLGNLAERDIPFSFSNVKQRREQLNKAVLTQMNAENTATRATPDVVVAAMDRSGGGIGDIAARTTLNVTPDMRQSIANVVAASKDHGADTYRIVAARARDLNALVNDGVIDGTAFKKWNSTLLEDIRNTKETKQLTLGKLQETALDAFEKAILPEDLPVWKTFRKEYAIGKQLMPVFAESTIGDISPTALMRAVNRGTDAKERMAYGRGGDLGELAKLSKQFIDESKGFSIPERMAGYGMLGGLGGGAYLAGNPAVAAGMAGLAGVGWTGASIYNLLGPSVVRSLTKAKENVKPLAPELTTSRGFQEMPRPTVENVLGDLTPDWKTSLGAGGNGSIPAVEANIPLGILKQGQQFSPMIGPRPLTPKPLTLPTDQLGVLGVSANTRLAGRPQMPVQPGLPGLSDVAISGYGQRTGKKAPNPFTDIAEGALPGMKVGPKQTGITKPWSATAGDSIQRLLEKPTDKAGVELSARIMKILNEPNKGISVPDQIMAILNENKGHTLSKQIMAILREYSPDTVPQKVQGILRG